MSLSLNRVRSEHELRPYQCRAASIIANSDKTALFIDMGLGKTAIVLTAFSDELTFLPHFKYLVIAPIKVCETVWRQEAKIWEHLRHLTFSLVRGTEWERAFALHREANIYLINPELVPWLSKHLRAKWDMFTGGLAIDESSLFKDHRSKRFKSLTNYGTGFKLRDEKGEVIRDAMGKATQLPAHKFRKVVIMTGTPRPQNMMNLWSQFYILDHGARLHKKFETFRGRYFHTAGEVAEHVNRYELNDGEDAPRQDYALTTGAPERIHELVADITVELDAGDYGLLPEIIPVPHMVKLPPDLRTKYDAFERDALVELNENMVIAVNGGVKTQMCWQMANGALYRHLEDGSRIYDELHEAKLDELDELILELDRNVLITYQFQHDKERILKRHPDAIVMPRKAEQVVDAWNAGRIRKLLIHPKSGAHGLNLQYGGNHIIWFSMLWSREQFDQANRRLARPGQPFGPVSCHMIMAENTTDELMEASLHEKGEGQARFRAALRKYQEARRLGMFVHDLPEYVFQPKNPDATEELL